MVSTCGVCGQEFRDSQCKRSRCPDCRRPKVPCPECGGPKQAKSGTCQPCRRKIRGPDHPSYRGGRTKHHSGYIMETVVTEGRSRYVMQHVLVMEDELGRRLNAGETVHHVNGVKDDNRPENLELWTRPQPTGIRVCDAIAHALETLGRHAPHLLN